MNGPEEPLNGMNQGKVLILTVPHGAAHERLAGALAKALRLLRPAAAVEVADALEHCTAWFRAYYNSYQIPLNYWPSLWGWIEGLQHSHQSTNPRWVYRRGGQPLFQFIQSRNPSVVVATEAGLCELAAMLKRETHAKFRLVAVPTGVDLDRAWAQPEVDLYAVAPAPTAQALEAWGVPRQKILACGVSVDPAFEVLPDRTTARENLGLPPGVPIVLILFGGTGVAARPARLMRALRSLREPFQLVAIGGRNPRLWWELGRYRQRQSNLRVLGWVENIQVWMAAADLLIGKPGGNTVFEALNCGLPLLIHDPLPGSQRRTCELIEQWGAGKWIRRAKEMPAAIEALWRHPQELRALRDRALAVSHPGAARTAARAILDILP